MVKIWAISDPHLSFGVPNKNMDVFGPQWSNYTDQIKQNWLSLINSEDLVLIPGDISWALAINDALIDLNWIHELPGTKVLIKGNHDYWWGSQSKVKSILPPSLHIIQNNAFYWKGIAIGGSRLWDTKEFNFNGYIDYLPNPKEKEKSFEEDDEKIFQRELLRLEMSLQQLNPNADLKIALTHYPPINADLETSIASTLLEKYRINICVFGHLHNVKSHLPMFGEKNGVKYVLASCDYLDFKPIQVF